MSMFTFNELLDMPSLDSTKRADLKLLTGRTRIWLTKESDGTFTNKAVVDVKGTRGEWQFSYEYLAR